MSRVINQEEVDLMNEELKALSNEEIQDQFDMLSVRIERLQKTLKMNEVSDIYPLYEATIKLMQVGMIIKEREGK